MLVGDLSIGTDLAPQRGWKTFARLAIDDHWDHTLGAAQHLEAAHLLVHVFALRRAWRANDDEELRRFECGKCLLGERVTRRKVLAIPEDWPQCLRHRADWRFAADQVVVDAGGLKRVMQPLAPHLVAVAVAQERAILELRDVSHAPPE
jgi:hypothetical protein